MTLTADQVALLGTLFTLLSAVVSFIAARAGASAAIRVHLEYLRRDVDRVVREVDAAHWRLDKHGAPAAPLEN